MSVFDDIIFLDPCNFTSLARTPWAGERISQLFKKHWCPTDAKIGEAWDFSCDPEMPSYIADDDDTTLADLIKENPKSALSGFQNHRADGKCEILVKILNASFPLSFQVHPSDGDESLVGNECGKPESWYVLDCAPGAGMYLGFSQPITRRDFAKAVTTAPDAEIKGLLNFVGVSPGDYFEIEPGVPHAIGPGVTLLEPQRIRSGQVGKTYRLWDWGRKYDAKGQENSSGLARELHLESGLRIIDPMKQVGQNFVNSLRRTPNTTQPIEGVELKSFTNNRDYQTHIVTMKSNVDFQLKLENGFASITTLSGKWGGGKSSQHIHIGQPIFLPHAALPMHCFAMEETQIALVTPAGSQLQIC